MHTAVLIPCYNEELTVASVVEGFRAALPDATIYVYDNNSSDSTAERAAAAGAVVRREPLQGKGNVIRRMFADIEADVYVMVDGDDTYDPASAPGMIAQVLNERIDMVVGVRQQADGDPAWNQGRRFGNRLLTGTVAMLFGKQFTDILSGYRAFSRRFVKSYPALARGFETETELTVHALELRLPVAEVETPYKARPEGSHSKLSAFRDGLNILMVILLLLKEERPALFFGTISALLAGTSLALAYPIVVHFIETGLVPRFPTAILCTGLMSLAFLSFTAGMILDSVSRGRREVKRMAYLALPAAPGAENLGKPALEPRVAARR